MITFIFQDKHVKKIILTLMFPLCLCSVSGADVADNSSFSVFGTSIVSNNLDIMWGGGADFQYALSSSTIIGICGYYSIHNEERVFGVTDIDLDYSHTAVMAGFNFYVPVGFLNRNRARLKSSIYAGYSWTEANAEAYLGSTDLEGGGFVIRPGISIEYLYSQHFMPFADCGWFIISGQGDLKSRIMTGFQFNIGIRYCAGSTYSYHDMY